MRRVIVHAQGGTRRGTFNKPNFEYVIYVMFSAVITAVSVAQG